MAQSRFYSATAQPTVLTASITAVQTVISVLATTGFPASVPYILALDYNTPSEEIVLVTAQAGTSLTVTRAYDGTSGTSHNTGAGVRHTWTAKDGNDSRSHEGSSQGVHGIGVTSSVVGTTDIQTLTNKTLTAPSIVGGSVTGAATINTTGTVKATGMPSAYTENAASALTTSTTYVDSSVTLSLAATVPPSGKMYISGDTSMYNNTTGESAYAVINVVGSVSGTIRPSNDFNAIRTVAFNTGDNNVVPGSSAFILTSGNPGETLTIKWQHRVSGGGAEYANRNLAAIPLLG